YTYKKALKTKQWVLPIAPTSMAPEFLAVINAERTFPRPIAFQGQHGRAYLFDTVVNVEEGPSEDRHMTTGLHTVKDIYCSRCRSVLGWKYERAYEQSQRYKEGKYILEKQLLTDVI
ncbi:9207_t:CDS:2, partial [Gigaspora rosea]